MYRLSFTYSTGYQALAAAVGATVTANVGINADADFECVYITGEVEQAGVLVANWSGLVVIRDSAVGRDMMDIAMPFDALRGDGRQPFPLNPPRLIKANSTLTITFTNRVATATNVSINFHGNKLME